MNNQALWIRRCCRALIVLQSVGIGWCAYSIFLDLTDDRPSEYFTPGSLVPWFLMVMLLIGLLVLSTVVLMRNADRRYAWLAALVLVFITTMPFTSQLMNWIRR